MESITESTRPAKMVNLRQFDAFADKECFMEVTEWSNAEGFDIQIDSKTGKQQFALTYGEFKALTVLINCF